ncbi:MAG: hypothetical protein KBF99_14815 [Leptospiraceae bacterium]|nr:hypothetical protein [Leptospiraceae bacterium]
MDRSTTICFINNILQGTKAGGVNVANDTFRISVNGNFNQNGTTIPVLILIY